MLYFIFFLLRRPPPNSTRTATHFPYTTLFRSRLRRPARAGRNRARQRRGHGRRPQHQRRMRRGFDGIHPLRRDDAQLPGRQIRRLVPRQRTRRERRSEEHTSELQSLMRISYAVFCLKKKNKLSLYTYSLL